MTSYKKSINTSRVMVSIALVVDKSLFNVMRIVEALIKAYCPKTKYLFCLVIFYLDIIHFSEIFERIGSIKGVRDYLEIVKLVQEHLATRKEEVKRTKKENIKISKRKIKERANLKLL